MFDCCTWCFFFFFFLCTKQVFCSQPVSVDLHHSEIWPEQDLTVSQSRRHNGWKLITIKTFESVVEIHVLKKYILNLCSSQQLII